MRSAGLLGAFLAAKALVLIGRDVPASAWAPAAYLWQDAAVVVAAALLELLGSRSSRGGRSAGSASWAGLVSWTGRACWVSRVAWTAYALACAYVALNVPVTRILSTPLTASMLRAARGTLADSILHHVTLASLGPMAAVAAVAAAVPFALRRKRRKAAAGALLVAAPLALLGPPAARRVETAGLERNVFAVLAATATGGLPAAPPAGGPAGGPAGDLRRSPFQDQEGRGGDPEDLTRLRGCARGRNVVLMLLESTGAEHLAPYGAKEDPMPTLTRLAREAVLFENAYAVYPESIKGLFSVLLSTSPAFRTDPETHARLEATSVAEALGAAGYRTGLFHSGRFAYLGMDAIVKAAGFQTCEDAGAIGGKIDSSFGVDEPSAVRRILSWIDAGIDAGPREQPFFATYLPVAGHHPYEAPEGGPYPERDLQGRYLNALRYGDAALAQLLDGLRSRGLLERTLLVLAGDHGEAFGRHEGNFGHTFHVYEENVRVPYVIHVPGVTTEAVRVRRPASLLDTAPAILDLLGLEPPPEWQGRSLLEP
ncbi:MAG: sulfatase, partial [Planctomycetes bacterium]|nr:sulfatase [Planctomycetota bacterium]